MHSVAAPDVELLHIVALNAAARSLELGSYRLYMLRRLPGSLPLATGPDCIHHIHDGKPCSDFTGCQHLQP